jgi:6-phosphofructokinase 1
MHKRMGAGRNDGVAILAEGLVEILPAEDIEAVAQVERDAHDHIRIAEINFGDIIKNAVTKRLAELNLKSTIVAKNIGYELRCADPVPADMEYTRDLGYCAARYVIDGGGSALISIQSGRFKPVPFVDIMDRATGRMRVRMVDIESDRYKIARTYMLRLKREDFDDPRALAELAQVAGVTPERFRELFGHLVQDEPPQMSLRGSRAPSSTSA